MILSNRKIGSGMLRTITPPFELVHLSLARSRLKLNKPPGRLFERKRHFYILSCCVIRNTLTVPMDGFTQKSAL